MTWQPGGPGFSSYRAQPSDHTGTKDAKIGMYFRFSEEGLRDYVGQVSDKDKPYVFGRRRPVTDSPFPFSLDELSKLLMLRSKIQERVQDEDGVSPVDRVGMYKLFWVTEGN